MIIVGIIILGLIILTVSLGFWYNWKLATAFLVPLIYAGYYLASTEVPKYFGYAIALNFAKLDQQSRFLSSFTGKDNIYLFILEKGDKEPRLISIPATEENKKVVKKLNEQVKSGQGAILKRPKGNKKAGTAKQPSTPSDIESVELKDQDIVTKDQE